jgi:hypothetical protein
LPKDNIALEQLHFRIQRTYSSAVRETEDRTLLKRSGLTTIKEERLRIDAQGILLFFFYLIILKFR